MSIDEEYKYSLEEVFFERYFEYGDDKETLENNLKIADSLYCENLTKVNNIAEMLDNGLIFDQTEAILAVQTLGLSYKYKTDFKEALNRL